MSKNRLFLLDAYALIFRGYYAFIKNPRINSKGMDTSAILGFTNSLFDVIKKERPDHLAVAFDKGGSKFRNDIFADYKANRSETPEAIKIAVPYIQKLLKALHIPIIELEGYEADDIIGTLARLQREQGRSCVVVTRDKDLTQVLKPGDEFWDYSGRRRLAYGQIADAFGVLPERMADFLALTGDPVDNIPGVPGVGKKTATVLLTEFESLEHLYQDLPRVKELPLRGAARIFDKLSQHKEDAMLARRLTVIADDMPLEGVNVARSAPNLELLLEVLDEAGLGGRLRRRSEALHAAYAGEPPGP